MVKNLPASAGGARDAGLILGQEDPLEKEMAIYSSFFTCKIPRTEEPDRLLSMGSQRVRKHTPTHTHSSCQEGTCPDEESRKVTVPGPLVPCLDSVHSSPSLTDLDCSESRISLKGRRRH